MGTVDFSSAPLNERNEAFRPVVVKIDMALL